MERFSIQKLSGKEEILGKETQDSCFLPTHWAYSYSFFFLFPSLPVASMGHFHS